MEGRDEGFTLIEVVIASVALAVVLLAVLGIYGAGQDACSLGSANLSLQTLNTRCMTQMTRQIRESHIFGIAADGSWIRLQVPVDYDGDGDAIDDDKNVEWGAEDRLNWLLEYAYYTEAGSGTEGWTFNEKKSGNGGIDLNGDGDRDDMIEFGCIVANIKDENGAIVSSRQITPRCIVLDIDGDGIREPLFKRIYANGTTDQDGPGGLPPDNNGPDVRIAFRSFKMADKERMVLLPASSVVATRNY
ncbi:MAG: prepilin-type N-terminal cleavage/methylation domain-containing protein [Planctomycetes bacterium]|nr:prepilin-type N-terminal cleavage/methylation domain-containing protein [Planctomycetota bacterium]